MTARTILVWLDFEATGLDIRKGHGELLEFAVVFTDLQLNELGCDEGVIPHKIDRIESIIQDKAREMHTANHLLDDLRSIQTTSWCFGEEAVKFTEDQLIGRLKRFLEEDPKTIFVIAGSSISYDRGALKEHMPQLEKMLHYRQLDVSVYKVGFPQIFGSESNAAHRAMADIRASISKHKLMREIVGDADPHRHNISGK